MELNDIRLFIKNNSKIISSKIDYNDDNIIYTYEINIQGMDHILKLIEDGDMISLDYNDNIINDEIEIQLELFELFNYKNTEYIDCYILQKQKTVEFDILDIYDDYYDNNEDLLICNRSYMKDDKLIKMKIIYQNEDYIMNYNLETIYGFEKIIEKIDLIFD
jgi:hypothetical protein